MRIATRGACLTVLLALVAVAPASGRNPGDLYALRYGAHMNVLMPYDPLSLRPSGPAIPLGRFGYAWSVSGDRTRLVTAAGMRRAGEPAALRFVDLRRGAVVATVSLDGERRRVAATAWVGGRVLAVVAGSGSTIVYSMDPERHAIVGRVEVPGVLVAGERTPSRLVLLLAPAEAIGPARIAIVDGTARARTVVLDRVTAGTVTTGEGSNRRLTLRRPGMAVARSGQRLYLFGADEPAAVLDLRTLALRYAPARGMAVARKRATGGVRRAVALADGRIVVWGYDLGASTAGLSIVDPRTWSRRVLDENANWVRVEAGLIFTRGRGGVGLRLLRPSGEAVALFPSGSPSAVYVVGSRALVTFFGSGRKAAVVELATRRVVGHVVPAHPLIGAGQPITD